MIYDLIVIGAGSAGLTAALYARRANKTVLLLEKGAFGGPIAFSPKVENYPGFESIPGSELADRFVEQVLTHGADVEVETVTAVADCGGYKTVSTQDGNDYRGRAVILAAGARHRPLGLPHEEDFLGGGISFCAVCDGAFYAGKTVALVGGGNSALQEAILLADLCKKVYVIQNLDVLTGEKRLEEVLLAKDNVEILTGTVVSAIPEGSAFRGVQLKALATGEERFLPLDGLFVAIGLEPENDAFAAVADLDSQGYLAAGEDCLTRTPGVFAAGDCRAKAVRQVATAISDGAAAAVAACRYLDSL
mgnify:FL=1